jgi:hypothetical protein
LIIYGQLHLIQASQGRSRHANRTRACFSSPFHFLPKNSPVFKLASIIRIHFFEALNISPITSGPDIMTNTNSTSCTYQHTRGSGVRMVAPSKLHSHGRAPVGTMQTCTVTRALNNKYTLQSGNPGNMREFFRYSRQ